MECFSHSGIQAVAICRGCGKGVCRECARDLGYNGIVCSDQCQLKVEDYGALYDRSRDVMNRTRVAYSVISVLFITMGTIFAWQENYTAAAFAVLFALIILTVAFMRGKLSATDRSRANSVIANAGCQNS